MHVIRAEAMGTCFGARNALRVTERIEHPETVTILGQLVHNEAVQRRLASRGFRMTAEYDRRKMPDTPNVLITAHGISDRRRRILEAAGRRLIDTTCPLVRRIHCKAQALEAAGYHVLVIGRPEHVEVQGIVEDLSSYDVIAGLTDVATWPHDRLGIVCQSTTPPRLAEQIRLAIGLRNLRAKVRFEDTICPATRDRQRAVERLLPRVDALVVVGGQNSNNTRELVALSRRRGVPAFRVESTKDIRADWFHGCNCIGLTAGTSTTEAAIDEVYEALCRLETGVAK